MMNNNMFKKLSLHARQVLFPFREQMLLLNRKGNYGQFAKARMTVKMEDITVKQVVSA